MTIGVLTHDLLFGISHVTVNGHGVVLARWQPPGVLQHDEQRSRFTISSFTDSAADRLRRRPAASPMYTPLLPAPINSPR